MSNTFYVDPVVEASKYGINVVADTFTPSKLKTGENGMIVKNGKDITIYVCPNDMLERQRFTIAHELGHFMCGHLTEDKTMFRDGNKEYSRDNYDPQEYEANNYAAELLMPVEKIEFLIHDKGYNRIEDLAEALIVSYTAMSIRLKNLGWIS